MIFQEKRIKQNEVYYSNILIVLGEGGTVKCKITGDKITKTGNKLICSITTYNKIKPIVSKWFLENKFEIKK